uniref:PH domain-containing protein n=1 Tax=Hyaloperonospora arabidopsidis (strain Emoy2) TaxID=559515 RepID=M4B5V0_HYAAE
MGLSRRAKAAEADSAIAASAPSPSSSSSISLSSLSTSRFLAFFHKKQDSEAESSDKRRPVQSIKTHHKSKQERMKHLSRSRSRSFGSGEEEAGERDRSGDVKLSYSIPRQTTTTTTTTEEVSVRVAARDISAPCIGVFPQRSRRSSSLQHFNRSSLQPTSPRGSTDRECRLELDGGDFSRLRRSSSEIMGRESSVDEFFSSFPRDLTADVRVTCLVVNVRRSQSYVRSLIVSLEFEIRATKWAAYFLQIVHTARMEKRLSVRAALSIKWVICAHVQGQDQARLEAQKRSDLTLQRKMTEYRVALQCVAGTHVVKFGRKGKPHATSLCVENGDTLRWTSKLLAHATHLAANGVAATTTMGKKRVKAKNVVPLASIVRVTSGPATSVLARALHKGTLVLADAGCTISVVTHTRTLDLKAKTVEEREWLQRSLEFLADLARDHERRVAQQVELTIMKRMETFSVWKYGRKGRPHKTRVSIDRFGEVSWLGRSGDSLQLDEIISVDEGLHTPVFARAQAAGLVSSAKAARCFSLVTALRSLDIEAMNEQQRDWFVVAFRYLLDKVHEKTAAMQRERAERQLRMLQDLCREDGGDDSFAGDNGDEMYYDDCSSARHR